MAVGGFISVMFWPRCVNRRNMSCCADAHTHTQIWKEAWVSMVPCGNGVRHTVEDILIHPIHYHGVPLGKKGLVVLGCNRACAWCMCVCVCVYMCDGRVVMLGAR